MILHFLESFLFPFYAQVTSPCQLPINLGSPIQHNILDHNFWVKLHSKKMWSMVSSVVSQKIQGETNIPNFSSLFKWLIFFARPTKDKTYVEDEHWDELWGFPMELLGAMESWLHIFFLIRNLPINTILPSLFTRLSCRFGNDTTNYLASMIFLTINVELLGIWQTSIEYVFI